MTYDEGRGVCVLFGGRGLPSGMYRGDTWEWDGVSWTQTGDTGPAPRETKIAYDPFRGVTVLYGGYFAHHLGSYFEYFGDTWEYSQPLEPSVLAHPQATSVAAGGALTLSVDALGSPPNTYQWRRDGVNLIDDGRISGSTTPSLRIAPSSVADAGAYDVIVTNVNGNAVGGPAAVTVTCAPDCNGDGLLNLADLGCFQTLFATANMQADCNQDALLNLADFGCFQTTLALGCP